MALPAPRNTGWALATFKWKNWKALAWNGENDFNCEFRRGEIGIVARVWSPSRNFLDPEERKVREI